MEGRSLRPWLEGRGREEALSGVAAPEGTAPEGTAPGVAAPEEAGGGGAAGSRPVGRPVLATAGTQRALVMGRWKLIHDLEEGRSRLYDLVADPGEERDLAAHRPRVLARLRTHLDRRLAATEGEGLAATGDRLERSRETERSLRALGYLQ